MNRLELDVEALKKQEKCGTCIHWNNFGKCVATLSEKEREFNSECWYEPSIWKQRQLNPEESLENLRRKQNDIVRIDNYEMAKLEIKKQKLYIAQLEKERDTYQESLQKQYALIMEMKHLLRES